MLNKEKVRRPPSKSIRFFEYFATPSGRRMSFYLAGAGALGLACANYLPHTVYVNYYRDFVQHYSFGIPTQVTPDVQKRIHQAADKLKIDETQKRLIKWFTVTGFNVFEIGSLDSIYGGWIGVPSNFYYKSSEDIDKDHIYIRSEPVKWNSEYGKLLEESLVLNDSEQVFAFCRALLNLQSYNLYLKTIMPPAIFLATYYAGQKINQHQNLFVRPFLIRYVVYTLLGLFGYGIWSFMTDFTNFQYEQEVDQKLADLGPDMVEAGVGFYTKLINRNIAIREIGGMDLYTAQGNNKYFLRIKEVPLTYRKGFFEYKLDELNKKKDESPTEKGDGNKAQS